MKIWCGCQVSFHIEPYSANASTDRVLKAKQNNEKRKTIGFQGIFSLS
jgi:hypothetical protein